MLGCPQLSIGVTRVVFHIDGLVQDSSKSSELAAELLQSWLSHRYVCNVIRMKSYYIIFNIYILGLFNV